MVPYEFLQGATGYCNTRVLACCDANEALRPSRAPSAKICLLLNAMSSCERSPLRGRVGRKTAALTWWGRWLLARADAE